ncbi:Uncharacterised protein [Chlamydia trachomatis]|nr:Uncharacterised protein [Chlamydia trachomatis]SYV91559.1 Uncharacterised protein [Mesomycoplasma hyorhinis]
MKSLAFLLILSKQLDVVLFLLFSGKNILIFFPVKFDNIYLITIIHSLFLISLFKYFKKSNIGVFVLLILSLFFKFS